MLQALASFRAALRRGSDAAYGAWLALDLPPDELWSPASLPSNLDARFFPPPVRRSGAPAGEPLSQQVFVAAGSAWALCQERVAGHAAGTLEAAVESRVVAVYHLVRLGDAWRVTARLAFGAAAAGDLRVPDGPLAVPAPGAARAAEETVRRYCAALAAGDAASSASLWEPASWVFQAVVTLQEPPGQGAGRSLLPTAVVTGIDGVRERLARPGDAGDSARGEARAVWTWLAGDVAWVVTAGASAGPTGAATAPPPSGADRTPGHAALDWTIYQLVRSGRRDWRLAGCIEITGIPFAGSRAGGGTVTGNGAIAPQPLAMEWGWGESPDPAVRSVGAADGWRPWADLLRGVARAIAGVRFRPPLAGPPGWGPRAFTTRSHLPRRTSSGRPDGGGADRGGTQTSAPAAAATALLVASAPAAHRASPFAWSARRVRWGIVAFGFALLVYVITRFWRIGEYPIYFFTDEAYLSVLGEQLLRNHFTDGKGHVLPMYFPVAGFTAPLLPAYFHAASLALLGRTVEITRATSSVFTIFAAASVGLTLKWFFRSPIWWSAPLFMATSAGWFVYTRTAFETIVMTSFFALFILFYLFYRLRSPWFLYPAILAAGGTFYSYSNGQAVAGVCGLGLALVDLRYHVRQWRYILAGAALVALVAYPYALYRRLDPLGATAQLRNTLHSPLYDPIPLTEKARLYAGEYFYGLSPQFWFFPNGRDLERHRLKGYPHIPTVWLPFALAGAGLCLWRIRSVPYRTLLIAVLATPTGAAVASVGLSRALAFMIPAHLFIVLGMSGLASLVRLRVARVAWGALLFFALSAASIGMLHDALTNGPTWYRNYGLYGQQWGARQVFGLVESYLRREPETQVLVSSLWANGTDQLLFYFFPSNVPESKRVSIGHVDTFMGARQRLTPNLLFVMTGEELQRAQASDLFSTINVERTLNYPDGQPGFYFVRLAYAPDVDSKLAAQRAARIAPVDDTVSVAGQQVLVRHSPLNGGSLAEMFDGNEETFARVPEANPVLFEFHFAQPLPIHAVALILAQGNWQATVQVTPADGAPEQRAVAAGSNQTTNVRFSVPLPSEVSPVTALRVEISSLDGGDLPVTHIRELRFLP